MSSWIQTRIIKSLSHDPWVNLAIEEHLLERITEDEIILYLWQNDNTVVIGRNQNAWKECRHLDLEREGGKLARKNAHIDSVQVFSDALEESLIRDIGKSLEGCPFRKDRMIERLIKVNGRSENQAIIIKDVVRWLSQTEF